MRYWQDRSRLAVKGALAAAAAWALARYAAGQADPYIASLAALLGVYPTVARSFREVAGYGCDMIRELASEAGQPVLP